MDIIQDQWNLQPQQTWEQNWEALKYISGNNNQQWLLEALGAEISQSQVILMIRIKITMVVLVQPEWYMGLNDT